MHPGDLRSSHRLIIERWWFFTTSERDRPPLVERVTRFVSQKKVLLRPILVVGMVRAELGSKNPYLRGVAFLPADPPLRCRVIDERELVAPIPG